MLYSYLGESTRSRRNAKVADSTFLLQSLMKASSLQLAQNRAYGAMRVRHEITWREIVPLAYNRLMISYV